MIDSHCHLDDDRLYAQLDALLVRGNQAHVELILTISTTLAGFPKVRDIAVAHENVFATVGVHPHETEEEGVPSVAALTSYAAHPKVVGLGETGLDYYYEHSKRDVQRESFINHIQVAKKTGLPLVVHSRDAEEDILEILADQKITDHPNPGVIHCFSGTQAFADQVLAWGFYISCSGIITFKKAEALRSVVATVPLERLLIETDAPYLAPVPYRGKVNEPAYVAHTAAKLAEIKEVDIAVIEKQTTKNFYQLFQKAAL